MKPITLLALGKRKAPMSTEIFIQAESSLDEIFVQLWGAGVLLGYARLSRAQKAGGFRAGRPVATFELVNCFRRILHAQVH